MAKRAVKKEASPTTCQCSLKAYTSTFAGGLTSGVTGELFTLAQNGKLTASSVLAPEFRDAVFISGVQQVAKDWSKAQLKTNPCLNELSTKNPLVFGALTGLPMWTITRLVANPLQNSRKKNSGPWDGFTSSIANELAYHTIKNGIDEYVTVKVFPKLLPQVGGWGSQRVVESLIAGVVGGATYVLAWPYKSALTGQSLDDALKLVVKMTPKISIKKATYTLAKPQFVKLLQ
jgi:hypothetical protein